MIGYSMYKMYKNDPYLGPTWFFGGFVVWMMVMTGRFYFRDKTERTSWEVKGRTVLGIEEASISKSRDGDVLSVRVEVA